MSSRKVNPWDENCFGVEAEPVFCVNCHELIHPGKDKDLCDKCHEYFYCECGKKLEPTFGAKGGGFCQKCQK